MIISHKNVFYTLHIALYYISLLHLLTYSNMYGYDVHASPPPPPFQVVLNWTTRSIIQEQRLHVPGLSRTLVQDESAAQVCTDDEPIAATKCWRHWNSWETYVYFITHTHTPVHSPLIMFQFSIYNNIPFYPSFQEVTVENCTHTTARPLTDFSSVLLDFGWS